MGRQNTVKADTVILGFKKTTTLVFTGNSTLLFAPANCSLCGETRKWF